MIRIVVRPSARRDQFKLAQYSNEASGEDLGDRFLSECDAGFERLGRFPESGVGVGHRHSKLYGCRMIPAPGFDKILIFYKALPDCVEVLRVLHGARDIDGMLH